MAKQSTSTATKKHPVYSGEKCWNILKQLQARNKKVSDQREEASYKVSWAINRQRPKVSYKSRKPSFSLSAWKLSNSCLETIT